MEDLYMLEKVVFVIWCLDGFLITGMIIVQIIFDIRDYIQSKRGVSDV